MATGFRGGTIFPTVFIGGTLGIAIHQALTSIPLPVAVGCAMAGSTIAILRLPVFVILFVSFFAGRLLVPLIVAAAVAGYVLVFDRPDLGGEPAAEPTSLPARQGG